jgi:hypothetical protein
VKLKSQKRIEQALEIARRYGQTDGSHHRLWVIDQMVRALTGCPAAPTGEFAGESEEYRYFVERSCEGDDGPDTYEWETGVAP